VRYRVEIDPRHFEHLSTPLLTGVMELIWNAIDADARDIKVLLKENSLGGIAEVEVRDDGHGIDAQTAKDGFVTLARSCKADAGRSKTLGRPLHGKEGEGRFKLFRHGGVVRWDSVSALGGQREQLRILIRAGEREVEIDELGPTDEPLGTTVTLAGFATPPVGLTGQAARDRLLAQFVLPIEDHGLTIAYGDITIDPAEVQEARDELTVSDSPVGDMGLTVIQWSRSIGGQRELHLCTADGAVLDRIAAGVPAPGLHFTAYLRWDGFSGHGPNLASADLDAGELAEAVGAGRRRLEAHLGDVLAHRQRRIIASWRDEGVYPFKGAPTGTAERATRQTFDVVALAAAETVNRANKANKKLSLRLLREALEHNPGHVHRVLDEVLSLEPDRLEDLTRLLERTQLRHIIAAATSIADRLDFLEALAQLTCAADIKDEVLERQNLHLMLEDETWVFGEEYALAASDAGLTQVLEQHVHHLGRERTAPEPVRDADGKARRVDLLLAQVVPHTDALREHLVVELKRPSVPIGPAELQQVKEYALAVASDPRFDTARTRWEFWAVSTDVKGTVESDRRQSGKPVGLVSDDAERRIRVWVKTWSEIMHDAEHRLKYVKQQLGVAPDQRTALDYLQRVHDEKLPERLSDSQAA
jgi:hypothetical protein